MMWRAMRLVDLAHRVIGCHLVRETRVQLAVDYVADNILTLNPKPYTLNQKP
jgi:hypothetical protein